MSSFINHRAVQKLFLVIGLIFFGALIVIGVGRSDDRKSLLIGAVDSVEESSNLAVKATSEKGSEVRLQDFHRVEVKDGRPAWEIRAKDARYLSQEGLTHVNTAEVTVYRDRAAPIFLKAEAGKLYMQGGDLTRAELEGGVKLEVENSMVVETDVAIYTAEKEQVSSPGEVVIQGNGFRLRGVGLEMDVGGKDIILKDQVDSVFEEKAQVPDDVKGLSR